MNQQLRQSELHTSTRSTHSSFISAMALAASSSPKMDSTSCLEAQLTRTLLTSLPPELIRSVVDFQGMSCSVIALWLSGSPRLQHLLRRSVTKMSFFDSRVFSTQRLPKMLSELPHLTHLTVDRNGNRLRSSVWTLQVLQSLSPTLETLRFNVREAGDLLVAGMSFFELSCILGPDGSVPDLTKEPYNHAFDLRQCFPALKTLEFDRRSNFAVPIIGLLPRTLTDLTCAFDYQDDDKIVEQRPIAQHLPALERLRVIGPNDLPKDAFLGLPSTLTTLSLPRLGSLPAKDLPRSLTELRQKKKELLSLSSEPLADLPRGLVSNSAFSTLETNSDVLLEQMPPSIREWKTSIAFSLAGIRQLPRQMTWLKIHLNRQQLGVGDLPPTLTVLEALCRNIDMNDFAAALPPSITRLAALNSDKALEQRFLDNLPKGITDLTIMCDTMWGNLVFSSPLVKLKLHTKESLRGRLPVIPESVRNLELHIPQFGVVDLISLPAALEELRLGELFDTHEFSHEHLEFQSRARRLLEVGLEKECLDEEEKRSLLSEDMHQTSVLCLLPRTLKVLHIFLASNSLLLHESEFKAFPKFLRELKLTGRSTHFSDLFTYLPMSSILKLTISAPYNVLKLTDKHIKRFNPNMKLFDVYTDIDWQITPNCAKCVPADLEYQIFEESDAGDAIEELWMERERSMYS